MSALPPINDNASQRSSVRSSVRSQTSSKAATASIRSSQRSSGSAAAHDVAVGGSVRSSQRSTGTSNARYSDKSAGSGSVRSITSSQALGKLAQLEDMLIRERHARESAENTLLALQKERIAREEATKKSESTEAQLSSIMNALQKVIISPDDTGNIRTLQQIVRNQGPGGARDKNAYVAPPSSNGSNRVGTTSVRSSVAASSTRSSVRTGEPRSFLDGVGQYERDRKREAKADKDRRLRSQQ